MQFKVPQFIDIEDKLFGPFTFYEFAYMAGGAGLIFIIYKLLPLWIGIFLMIPVAGLTAALVWYKINNKSFAYYLQAGFTYLLSSKLYIWKQRLVKESDIKKEEALAVTKAIPAIPVVSSGRIKDLAWSLDIQEKEK